MSEHREQGQVEEVELAQGLGLLEALTIGIGTMIGAGIFVLPGFIFARARPGAVLSFLLGGVVAMFAAMSAAEVATGMPRSGGGYYFISRALGPAWGAIIGWGSWFGLIFATAFYAVGFGEYLHAWLPLPVKVLAVAMIVALVALNLVGSEVAGKNLPRALLWSVGGVTALYVVVVGIVVLLGPWEELTGPTVVADLATSMLGPVGGLAILVGAIMATVSSANASIMSASRISFAMGRDRMMWAWFNKVHPKYRVPHRAIYATGALILVITLLGDIELLAEAAGLLHLLMYGLICVATIILRGARPLAYRPVYRVPFFHLLAGLERNARAHLLLLREQGRIPPRRILVFVGAHPARELPLLLAARMSTHWRCELTVLTLVPPESEPERLSEAEAALESQLGETVRARFLAVAAPGAEEVLEQPALGWDMVVLGADASQSLREQVEALDRVHSGSLVVVRTHPSQPVELWM